MSEHLGHGTEVAGVERPEFRVTGTRLVKSHPVDDILQVGRVSPPERDPPFPVFQANSDSNQLRCLTGKRHSAAGVFGHQAGFGHEFGGGPWDMYLNQST